jgi:hypothetical protein
MRCIGDFIMWNKARLFEELLLNTIKDGNGSLYQIMILSHEHNIGTKTINKIIDKHINENNIIWAGNKFKIVADIN